MGGSMSIFYGYIDIHDPFVAWEAAIGRICSADHLEREQVYSLSLRQFALLKNYASSKKVAAQIRNELRLEGVRASRFAELPSRLRGVFLFNSIEDARGAQGRLGWNGRHFNHHFLSEIEMVPALEARLDSEWISSNLAAEGDASWMDRYWQGDVYGERPLEEVICSGVGAILNKELRERAYRRVMASFPKAVPLLRVACVAFWLGYPRAAQIVPCLCANGTKVRAEHRLNMSDFRDGSPVFPALDSYKMPWPPLAEPWDGVIQVPDLRPLQFELEMPEFAALLAEATVPPLASEGILGRIRDVHAAIP